MQKIGHIRGFWQRNDDLVRFWLQIAILQVSDRKMVILHVSGRMNGYLARFRQNEWLSFKILAEWTVILQDSGRMNGYLARFWQKLLQRFFMLLYYLCNVFSNLATPVDFEWLSCKYLVDSARILQDNHSKSTGGLFGWFFAFKICFHDTITKNFIEMHFWKLWKRTFWKFKRFSCDEMISFQRSQICCFWH